MSRARNKQMRQTLGNGQWATGNGEYQGNRHTVRLIRRSGIEVTKRELCSATYLTDWVIRSKNLAQATYKRAWFAGGCELTKRARMPPAPSFLAQRCHEHGRCLQDFEDASGAKPELTGAIMRPDTIPLRHSDAQRPGREISTQASKPGGGAVAAGAQVMMLDRTGWRWSRKRTPRSYTHAAPRLWRLTLGLRPEEAMRGSVKKLGAMLPCLAGYLR